MFKKLHVKKKSNGSHNVLPVVYKPTYKIGFELFQFNHSFNIHGTLKRLYIN